MKSNVSISVRLAELAFLLDLTERRVQQLVVLGVLARERKGYYPLAESVRSYIRYCRKQPQQTDGVIGFKEALESWGQRE